MRTGPPPRIIKNRPCSILRDKMSLSYIDTWGAAKDLWEDQKKTGDEKIK
jgi:hypothetical protein